MNPAPQTPALLPWRDLKDALSGSFTVRARGLLANTYVLQKDGSEAGRLLLKGSREAEFTAGDLEARIERDRDNAYEMFSREGRILTAAPLTSSLDALEIACGGNVYPAHISFFRNEATASSPKGGELVYIKGSFVGRRYEANVDRTDDAALPAAILLLYHTISFRRRLYIAGSAGVPRG